MKPNLELIAVRGANEFLRREAVRLRRQNALLRAVLMHDCPVCRIAWCPERERLVRDALGRQWLLLGR